MTLVRIEGETPVVVAGHARSPKTSGSERASHLSDAAPGLTGASVAEAVSQSRLALADIAEGACAFHLWALLGWQDILQRYRRSLLGPFWLTISMGAMIGGIGLVYAGLFGTNVSSYFPFLALGFIVWTLISSLVIESCNAFVSAAQVILQVRLPLSLHVYRVVWRNFIIFAHNILIFVVVAVAFTVSPSWAALMAVPGLALILINGVWIGIVFGLVSARFRDVPLIVASVMQVAFFLTPILWKPEQLPATKSWVLRFNPFFYFLDLVRLPLLGVVPPLSTWLMAFALTLVGCAAALVIYRRYRPRLTYWL